MAKYVKKICNICNREFSCRVTSGPAKQQCSVECRNRHKYNLAQKRFLTYPECKTHGCKNKATRVGHGLCETCYYRIRRTGSTYKKNPAYRYITGAGYVTLSKSNHPLSDNTGRIYEHRYVVYNYYKGIEPGCFWCGKDIKWEDAVIDHLDENKANNKIDNLVFSCSGCNRARGAMLPFIERMKETALDVFIDELKKHRDNKNAKS